MTPVLPMNKFRAPQIISLYLRGYDLLTWCDIEREGWVEYRARQGDDAEFVRYKAWRVVGDRLLQIDICTSLLMWETHREYWYREMADANRRLRQPIAGRSTGL